MMKPVRLAVLRRVSPFIPTTSRSIRRFSIAPCLRSQDQPLPFPLDEAQFATLKEQLMQREMPILRDRPKGAPSALLETTLRDFLPLEFKPPEGWTANGVQDYRRHASFMAPHVAIPFSYHLIFFPPLTSLSELLSDSTDPAQSPGEPFDRRMWAGGSIEMRPSASQNSNIWAQPSVWHIDRVGRPFREEHLACVERISDVQLKGTGDSQKIFVTLERRIGALPPMNTTDKWRKQSRPAESSSVPTDVREKLMDDTSCSVIEKRNLVFMNNSKMPKPKPKPSDEPASPPKVVKAPHPPDYSVTLTPNANLLFRFSALTYNAHRIHLDKDYCRNVEGHRNLLVHGPLSVVLMSEILRGYLDRKYPALLEQQGDPRKKAFLAADDSDSPELITSLEYRNLAPVYAEEEMRVCLRQKETTDTGAVYEVWVENGDGSMCVRGTATTRKVDVAKAKTFWTALEQGLTDKEKNVQKKVNFSRLSTFPMQGLEWKPFVPKNAAEYDSDGAKSTDEEDFTLPHAFGNERTSE